MARTAEYYREKAARFRELLKDSDEPTAAALRKLIEEFEAEAQRLEPRSD